MRAGEPKSIDFNDTIYLITVVFVYCILLDSLDSNSNIKDNK